MSEKKNTEQELEQMADALLAEADKKEEPAKKTKGKLDDKTIAALPAAAEYFAALARERAEYI